MNYINGKAYEGNSISVINGRVFVDGKEVTDSSLPKNILTIKVEGTLASLETTASVNAENIAGDVIAGGSVNCDDVGGSVYAKGSVNCDDVGGNVRARGSVNKS